MIKGVVFDLDGTLLNTIAGIQKSVNRVLQKYGFPLHTESYYKAVVGHGMKSLLMESIPDSTDIDVDEILEKVLIEYDNHYQIGTIIYPGIPDILTFLENNNIPMAILSNKPIKYVMKSVESFLDQWTFYPVIGENSVVPKKPNPYGLNLIAQKLHLPVKELLMVGDSAIDIETAIAAKAQHAGALWGFKDHDELAIAGAQHIFSHPRELFDLLGGKHEAYSIT